MNNLKALKLLIALCVTLVLPVNIFAHGKKDIDEKTAGNPLSWQDSFDLTEKKKGKYNIMITASDLGGNTTVEGPYNMYVDPKSDLPICGITNPRPNMRVLGNLNIVGTCIDDDAVQYVELVLDGDESNPIRANGKEFWSHYLDTNNLEEGPHTIKVTGYDINGLVGNPFTISWNLDRRQPLTNVDNYEMGTLVSGMITFKGTVADGNGIKSLAYSIDNGETFRDVKLSGKKGSTNFTLPLDTKKFPDGPAVIWFKAHDITGSEGIYSFLYFVDNTKPDVKIIYPEEKEAQNGKFLIGGYAKDVMGLTKLSWKFGTESGDFELIPGNPYWGMIFDTIGSKDKSRKFEVTAHDIAGNTVTVSRIIPLNQDADKPLVSISDPNENTLIGSDDVLFIRGIANDDDGISSVKYSLDNGEWIEEETKGVFCGNIAAGKDISPGLHKVTVIAKDINGVESNPYTAAFKALGPLPVFSDLKIGTENFTDGMSVHPEAGLKFQTTISSGSGLSAVHYDILWGNEKVISKDIVPNKTSAAVIIPIDAAFPKGIVKIHMTASDSTGRTKDLTALLDVINTSELPYEEPKIVFGDSTVDENGVIINNSEFPATGYFTGGKAAKAEIVPATQFASAELHGNQIVLVPGKAVGSSEPVIVRITTDQGLRYDSQKLIFKNDTVVPAITINDADKPLDGTQGAVTISGKVESATGIGKLSWRLFSSKAVFTNGIITALEPAEKSEWNAMEPSKTFAVPFNSENYETGLYIVEILAESSGGNKSSAAVCINTIPAAEEAPAKGGLKAPLFMWADGENVYYAAYFNMELENAFGTFARANMNAGNNSLTATVNAADGKSYPSKYNALNAAEVDAHIASINGSPYMSGMPVEIAQGSSAALSLAIDTNAQVGSVSYEITGTDVPGGTSKQAGSVKLSKPVEGTRWTAEIPLTNLPVRMNNIKLTVNAGASSKTVTGSFGTVRPANPENTDDLRAVYVSEGDNTQFNKESSSYVMVSGGKLNFYANTPELQSAEFAAAVDGFTLETQGNNVIITANKDGSFNGVSVRVKDVNGATYTSKGVNIIVDSGAPEVHITTPELHQWVKTSIKISGTASDYSGIKSGEYSIDGGQNWQPMSISVTKGAIGGTFNATADISSLEEGLVDVDVRVFDAAGYVCYAHTAVHKDTLPPDVKVILPNDDAVVNGTNLMAFTVSDAGNFDKAYYIFPASGKNSGKRNELEAYGSVLTNVGTEEQPIDPSMSFQFADSAGNITEIAAWKFSIDSQSDLPISEIHLPIEDEVITKDFTISGVIYDDDGASKIYYKIDNGEYKALPEAGTSFAIDVPFSTMVDNEHTAFVYAVDANGVKGPVAERKFRVSTEEPKGSVIKPAIDTSVKKNITITGTATDKNGIEKVQVSLDNGNSYNDAVGQEEWSYTFDTQAIPNGTQVVFVRVFDKYGIEGLYSSLINIDNANPELMLDLPMDSSYTAGPLFFSGYAFDNVNITELFVTVRSLEQKSVPKAMQHVNFSLDRIIAQTVDMSGLENGSYNIEITALDKAGNETHLSRNVFLNKNKPAAVVDLLYPLNGEHKQGNFNIYGTAIADKKIETLSLYVDDKHVEESSLTSSGYFVFNMLPEKITAGNHTYRVDARVEGGTVIRSREQTLTYSPAGPWITTDNFNYGDFASNRPYIIGRAGYSIDEEELALSKSKNATKEQKSATSLKKVAKIEISFDNGKTFKQVSKSEKWRYRIENQDLAEGYHFMLVRATMSNGESCIERTIIQIDNTKPEIRLISPNAGGRYNQELVFSGLASDNVELKDVKLTLRKGDKASYQLPSFIQGLYLDTHFWGATLFDIGVGLTFFDDNVKLQFQWGQFTQQQRNIFSKTDMRYGGDSVIGIKILANVGQIPFSYFFGRDLEWLSANFAIGANFSRFNETNSGTPQILSALLGQIEFPKVSLPQLKMFSAFSLYTEFSLWFIPTDVSGTIGIKNLVPQISEGIRVNIF